MLQTDLKEDADALAQAVQSHKFHPADIHATMQDLKEQVREKQRKVDTALIEDLPSIIREG